MTRQLLTEVIFSKEQLMNNVIFMKIASFLWWSDYITSVSIITKQHLHFHWMLNILHICKTLIYTTTLWLCVFNNFIFWLVRLYSDVIEIAIGTEFYWYDLSRTYEESVATLAIVIEIWMIVCSCWRCLCKVGDQLFCMHSYIHIHTYVHIYEHFAELTRD